MIVRPKQFYIVAVIMFMIALSFPVQVMFLYGHHWSETAAIFGKITTLNWFVIGCFFLTGYLYFQASRFLLVVAPLMVVLVGVNNYLVGQFAGDFSLAQTSLGTFAVALLYAPLMMPSSQVVLKDPKRRWWRRSRRYNKRVSATINPYVGDMIQAYTFDVSQTGAFVCLDNVNPEEMPKVGDTIRLSFNVTSMRKIRCEAEVVRIAEAQGRYPAGMGVRILEIEKIHQKSFQSFVNSQDYSH